MILDSSAIVAILVREPSHEEMLASLGEVGAAGVGAPTISETGVEMVARMGIAGGTLVSRFIHEAGLTVIPFTETHGRTAIDAYFRFGKGRHPASLNFGDCLTYAVAAIARRPLLCVGDDFAKTDLELVRS